MLELLLGHAQHAAEGFDVSLKLRHRVVDAVGAKIQLAQLVWQVVSSLQDGYQPNEQVDADLRKLVTLKCMYSATVLISMTRCRSTARLAKLI